MRRASAFDLLRTLLALQMGGLPQVYPDGFEGAASHLLRGSSREQMMSETEAALASVRGVIDALNSGEDTDVLAGMTEDVVIIDDVAPFRWTGRPDAQEWLRRVAQTRKRLSASFSSDSAAVQLVGNRAYLVAPGTIKGSLARTEFEVDGLVISTLVAGDGKWLVDSLVWSCSR